MYNWSVDEKRFKRDYPEKYEIWKLEQLINFGLGRRKLEVKKIKKHWRKLYLDPDRKRYLRYLIWGKIS